jgi:hypothetical protein
MNYFEKGIKCSRDASLHEETNKNHVATKTWRKKGKR